MFFKRVKEEVKSFEEQLSALRSNGYQVETLGAGGARVSKGALAAIVKEGPAVEAVGLLLGSEVAVLTDLGYQKIFLAPSGHKTAAVADHLTALHAFDEDLRLELGVESLYNEGLGSTNGKHLYDRVKGRDAAAQPKPWAR